MEWVVGIQVDADARIFYVHMDDLKHCAPPDPVPSWPDVELKHTKTIQNRVVRNRLDQLQAMRKTCVHQL